MKKIILVLFIISFILIINKSDYVVIPDNSIRFRIIPNSNNTKDIMIKEKIKKEVINLFDGTDQIEESIPLIDKRIKKVLEDNKYKKDYKIKYGSNYFPRKVYKGVVYNEGSYKSLVIELGEGKGSNFWCVLFPPLCNLESKESTADVEYKLKVKEIIDKLMNKI